MRTYTKDCSLVACGGNGWVRFWDIASSQVGGEFIAHQQVSSVIMEVDESEKYLATGDVNGLVKVWDISQYCLNFSPNNSICTSERNYFPYFDYLKKNITDFFYL